MAGTLYVVATPIGNLDDITARALRTLRDVHLIAAEDTRRTAHLLTRFGITTPTTSLHAHNEKGKAPSLVARLVAGEHIALVSDAGTPGISDPGVDLVNAATAAGIRVEPIPGPSAVTALLSVSGLQADRFTFMGFPPIKANNRKQWFLELAGSRGVVVFYEAPHRIGRTLQELMRSIGDAQVVVGRELTKIHENLAKGPISYVIPLVEGAPGEFAVAVNLVESHKNEPAKALDPATARHEFCRLTENEGLTRRNAITRIAQMSGLSAREVYALLEEAKISDLT
ncbi:MAG: 16S rRNA (cytidine(1402)-2'-O)-methyltransferase [Acidobacteriaceae bacterium]|jgi:16S rRNA (cytidine1402-2'-O)-methyltransferase|nr:16S rRNA (cytidine(1402)-2'-O)-methyltransferase [Acidobacteriaceae bacterium]